MTAFTGKRPKMGYVNIDGAKAREIIRKSGYSTTVLSRALNRSECVIQQACKAGRMNKDYIDKIKAIFGVDLTPAIIPNAECVSPSENVKAETGTEQAETEPAKEKSAGWLKVVEDYSYIRSNDSDRITAAIDRLTAVLQEINKKL